MDKNPHNYRQKTLKSDKITMLYKTPNNITPLYTPKKHTNKNIPMCTLGRFRFFGMY